MCVYVFFTFWSVGHSRHLEPSCDGHISISIVIAIITKNEASDPPADPAGQTAIESNVRAPSLQQQYVYNIIMTQMNLHSTAVVPVCERFFYEYLGCVCVAFEGWSPKPNQEWILPPLHKPSSYIIPKSIIFEKR